MIFKKKAKENPDAIDPISPQKKQDKMVVITILSLIGCIIVVSIMFIGLISSYRSNTSTESASHLTEINRELRLYVETKINEYWNAAHSIADSLCVANISDDAMLDYLATQRDIYDISDITLFTRSGYAVNVNGKVLANDIASEMVSNINDGKESLSIKESTVVYTVAVNTNTLYHGSEIVAVSVEQDLSSFLDNMGISAFDGTGLVYLTNNNGALISKLTRPGSDSVYNLFALLENSVIRPLSDNAYNTNDLLTSKDSVVFLRETDAGDQYVVSSPIQTGYDEMRLFYFVPENIVNQTTKRFSGYIITLSIVVILVFVAGAVVVFLQLYNARKKRFDKDISLREHMLELLVQNSNSAFALHEIGQSEPRFRAGNGERITGVVCSNLERADSGYRFRNVSGAQSQTLKEINSQLIGWDGKHEFRSTFLRNNAAATPVYFELQIFPAENSEKKEVFIVIVQDATPLYERQAIVSEALAMAEQANQAKTHFLSNMSHDIRTPMNAIVNMADFALESIGEPEKQRDYLNTLRESSNHLLQLINDVLDMSRIESGRLIIASEPFNLLIELNRIADIVRTLCEKKEQTFIVDFSELHSYAVMGDPVKLSQILMNLLSNASKFTQSGGVVRFKVNDLPALRKDAVSIRFKVEDSGIGISEKDLKNIFEAFSRVENAQVNKIEGTGLGLSICRSYINAMGGTITCESEQEKGSIFTVELSFTITQLDSHAPVKISGVGDTPFAGRRCLICEDNNINLLIAAKLLERLGFSVESASNGKEGFEKFKDSSYGYYDVIYMDVQMPVMDGYDATLEIRNSTHPQAKTVPIIAMTANIFAEDVERARSAGMNGHLGKPILVNELIETTNTILNNEGLTNEESV